MATVQAPSFDPLRYKETTERQWQAAAGAWNAWTPVLRAWLGPATDLMLDMARVGPGSRVLDVAAGAGDQTLQAAKRVGPNGFVLATDIASRILEYAAENARAAGFSNVETLVADGENLDVNEGSFDAVISRVGLIYFPDQQKALAAMKRALRPGGRIAAIVYSTADRNGFFSLPVSIIRRRAQLPPPAAGQPGPFSLGTPGAIEDAYRRDGFHDIEVKLVPAPLRVASASECIRFERESFGALHQLLSGLDEAEREAAWAEIAEEMRRFERDGSFDGPCELVVASGVR